jgi:hypothetical protein
MTHEMKRVRMLKQGRAGVNGIPLACRASRRKKKVGTEKKATPGEAVFIRPGGQPRAKKQIGRSPKTSPNLFL